MSITPARTSSTAVLRQRADALRVLARRMESVDMRSLVQRCGTDTWVGPSQQHWDDELRRCMAALVRAAGDTRAAARRLERQAEQLDLAEVVTNGGVR